ncbi:MAG: 5'-methylthioadenosine/adenosylhomocysteine nucleosidase [Trueperaceae bacterium]|nr:5'-methylthioadenosine/adenosylhomocysteine nucleosidase [Trueperaceae bacterium]
MTPLQLTAERPLAVIGAMEEEVAPLLAAALDAREEGEGPYRWHRATLDGVPVLLAACGIGKVNAAALTQALLGGGASAVIFTGVAGGVDPGLRVGDLVVAHDALQHDVDVTPLGYEEGQVPGEPPVWAADPGLRDLVAGVAADVAGAEGVRSIVGRVASGDTFVADPKRVADLRRRFGASCAEMEGAAVAQVCARWGVPWAIVRSVSDTADHDAGVDFRAFTEEAARRAVAVVRGTLRRWA